MRFRNCRVTVLTGLLMLVCRTGNATKVAGYIVDNGHDTIYGLIKLRNVSQKGILLINGFDTESLHEKVLFMKKGTGTFQTYLPNMIQSFGFRQDSMDFVFRSFLIEHNTVFYNDKSKYRFLRLIYDGSLDLYQDITPTDKENDAFAGARTNYYEFFIGTCTSDVIKAAFDDKIKTVRDILDQFDVEGQYIYTVPEATKIKDLLVILQDYDQWLLIK
jgi:hypothetical protein